MHHRFDLFEKFPDGSSLWRACVLGREGARHHLMELAKASKNHFYTINVENGKITHHIMGHGGMEFPLPQKMGRKSKSAVA